MGADMGKANEEEDDQVYGDDFEEVDSDPAFFAMAARRSGGPFDEYDTPDGYTEDWETISVQTRRDANWTCRDCDADLHERTSLLHVHHIDYNRRNNDPENLCVLCVVCHAAHHPHMIVSAEDRQYILNARTFDAE